MPQTSWRASAVRPGGKPLQIISPLCCTMISEVVLQIIVLTPLHRVVF